MSSSPTEHNALLPTLFLIGVTVLLVFFAIPRPYRDPLLATPTPLQTVVAIAVVEPTPEDHLILMASGREEVAARRVKEGSRWYSTTCIACHGSDAKGILGLGKTLIGSEFVNKLNDDELVAFLHVGRTSTDPENTTGVAMPAKGGNPSLTDNDLNMIVDYMRSLNGATVVNDVVGEPTPIPTLKPFQTINPDTFSAVNPESPSVMASVTPAPSDSASPTPGVTSQETSIDATPVTSYGYDTQSSMTETPVAPASAMTPTIAYNYITEGDATNVPVNYGYEAATTQP